MDVSSAVIGDCRLCGATKVALLDSHILPKWAYRRARGDVRSNGAPDPIRFRDGVVVQTSSQIKEYMLCAVCEGQLGKDEDVVARLAYQVDGTAGLVQNLPGPMIRARGPKLDHARATSIAHLDCQAIARFAASVFWRAAVAQQANMDGLKLWKAQVEALRRFVRGEARLPDRFCLTVFLLVDGEDLTSIHSTTLTTPATAKKGDDSFHQFIVAGLLFNLATGTHSNSRFCLACSSSPHVIIQDWKAVKLVADLSDRLRSAQPKGSLARTR